MKMTVTDVLSASGQDVSGTASFTSRHTSIPNTSTAIFVITDHSTDSTILRMSDDSQVSKLSLWIKDKKISKGCPERTTVDC